MERVISHLAAIAKERREAAGPLPRHEVARKSTIGEDALRKFEGGDQGRNIDRMAAAYADALGVSVFELWDAAIERAKKASDELGPTLTADERTKLELEAEHHKAALRKAAGAQPRQARPSGSRTAKSGRGSRKK